MINLKTACIFLIAGSIAACDNNAASKSSGDSTTTSSSNAAENNYSCPMHPEVTGKKGDTCHICGMELEKTDTTSIREYFMEFRTAPESFVPGDEVTLSLLPKKRDKQGTADLDVTHEKKIHLIVVSDDLSMFQHLHPDLASDGSYKVKAQFPIAGNFHLFADYKPAGGTALVDKFKTKVQGPVRPPVTFSSDKLSGTSGNYSIELKPASGKFTSGSLMHIEGIIKKNGKPVDANTLDNYLGAKAHFVVVGVSEKDYLHVHPGLTKGNLDLQTTFTKPGVYRGWVQFNGDGKIHTIDFTMNVVQGTNSDPKKEASDDHSNHH